MTKWLELTNEERSEWRRSDIAQAYVDALQDSDSEYGTEALRDMVAGRLHEAGMNAGRQEGILRAIDLFNYEVLP